MKMEVGMIARKVGGYRPIKWQLGLVLTKLSGNKSESYNALAMNNPIIRFGYARLRGVLERN